MITLSDYQNGTLLQNARNTLPLINQPLILYVGTVHRIPYKSSRTAIKVTLSCRAYTTRPGGSTAPSKTPQGLNTTTVSGTKNTSERLVSRIEPNLLIFGSELPMDQSFTGSQVWTSKLLSGVKVRTIVKLDEGRADHCLVLEFRLDSNDVPVQLGNVWKRRRGVVQRIKTSFLII